MGAEIRCTIYNQFFQFEFLQRSHEGNQSDFYQLGLVCGCVTGVAVGVHEHLGVGMNGKKSLDVTVGVHKVHNGLHFRLRVSAGSMVGF